MFICLLVLYILGWLTQYLNLDTSLVYISKWEYTLCCVWHLSWTWSVPTIRIHLKLDSSFWIWVSEFVNHIHIWQWNTSLSSFWRYIKHIEWFINIRIGIQNGFEFSCQGKRGCLLSQNSKEAAKCPLPRRLPKAKCLGDGNYCLPITRTFHRPDFHCSK